MGKVEDFTILPRGGVFLRHNEAVKHRMMYYTRV